MNNYSGKGPKILITGGQGQLARALSTHPHAKKLRITTCSRDECDITNPDSISHVLSSYSPDIIINTAAYTAVDKAESEPDLAALINHQGAQNLANACAKREIPLIHLSTDYVFDGTKSSPYIEDDLPNPINVYGKTKWQGEEAIRKKLLAHVILRVSGIFSEYGNNFFKTILKLAAEKSDLHIVADQITCPTYAMDVADTLLTMACSLNHFGTYHYCGKPAVSWHDFAVAIIEKAKQSRTLSVQTIQAITTLEYHAAAKRPAYSVLDCQKIERDFGIHQPEWRTGIVAALAKE